MVGKALCWCFIVPFLQISTACHSGWVQHLETCYFFSSFTATWPEASSYCKTFNSKLAEPLDQDAITFLGEEVKAVNTTGTPYYIGGGDLFVEGEWIWISTQEPIDITRWAPNEPNDNGSAEDCLEVTHSGMWNDDVCSNPKRFICEKENDFTQPLVG